ncbi:alpha/beta fold hydrolase [Loigolactobacillus iwatensis]|uniref:alpha/beta fold hydrolase n=1 Tax=Loigolactobacillus iwatensis TaxID=1267156 RepID=UPI000F7E22FE|nr:alpha/beta hydrolase [Loigolactobacillus iwatensis]
MTQPILDHESNVFKQAEAAETKLLSDYGLKGENRWLTYQGLQVRILIIGEGTPVLVVPGNTGDPYPWIPLFSKLPGYKFYVMARPGGGLSDGMDHNQVEVHDFAINLFTSVLDQLKLDRVPLLAHSMGAHWSTWYALAHPERITQVITTGNPGRILMDKTPGFLKAMALPGVSKLADKLVVPKDADHALRNQKLMGTDPDAVAKLPHSFAEATFAFDQLPNFGLSTISLLQAMNDPKKHNGITAEQLATLQVPMTLLWGSNDTFEKPELGEKIAQASPHGRLEEIKGAGHMPWLDRPEEVASIILKQLAAVAE